MCCLTRYVVCSIDLDSVRPWLLFLSPGAKTGSVKQSDAGRCLSEQLCKYMKHLGIPNGLSALGFTEEDFPKLIERTLPQKSLTNLSPMPVCESLLETILKKSLSIYD